MKRGRKPASMVIRATSFTGEGKRPPIFFAGVENLLLRRSAPAARIACSAPSRKDWAYALRPAVKEGVDVDLSPIYSPSHFF